MAARHLDEGLLGWLLAAAAITGGLGAIGVTAYIGARLGRTDVLAAIDHQHD